MSNIIFIFLKRKLGIREVKSAAQRHTAGMSHDSNSILTPKPMHESSTKLGHQRLDSWDPDLEGPLCLDQLLRFVEKDNQRTEVSTRPHSMSG